MQNPKPCEIPDGDGWMECPYNAFDFSDCQKYCAVTSYDEPVAFDDLDA